MMKMFENAKFGDKYLTRFGKIALFLRFVENSEWKMVHVYVQDFGIVAINRETGNALRNGEEFDILKKINNGQRET